MSESDPPTIERVKELAQQLSPEERKLIALFLADLADSGFGIHGILKSELTPKDKKELAEAKAKDGYYSVFSPYGACVWRADLPLFEIQFHPENYCYLRKEKTSKKPPDVKVAETLEELKAMYLLEGTTPPPDTELTPIVAEILQNYHEQRIDRIANAISNLLRHIGFMTYSASERVAEFSVDNQLAIQAGHTKKKVAELIENLKPLWQHLTELLDIGPGGNQGSKHDWTPKDVLCLNLQYDRLKPVWRDAQKTARQALKARTSRRANWRDVVKAAYKEENLPNDLIDQLNPELDPKLRTRPSHLALLHAARICLPASANYTPDTLEEKLKLFKGASHGTSKPVKKEGDS